MNDNVLADFLICLNKIASIKQNFRQWILHYTTQEYEDSLLYLNANNGRSKNPDIHIHKDMSDAWTEVDNLCGQVNDIFNEFFVKKHKIWCFFNVKTLDMLIGCTKANLNDSLISQINVKLCCMETAENDANKKRIKRINDNNALLAEIKAAVTNEEKDLLKKNDILKASILGASELQSEFYKLQGSLTELYNIKKIIDNGSDQE